MNIYYHISQSTKTEDFVAKIYEASSPNAEIASQTIPAPHTLPTSVSFTGLDKVTHIVRLFGVTSGIMFHEYDVEPTDDIVTVFDDIHFKIGDGDILTPAAESSTYINSILAGLTIDDFRVWRNGYGFLYPDLHYSFSSIPGEIALTFPDVFGDGEEILITRKPSAIKTIVNDSVVGKLFGGNSIIPQMFIDVNSTVNYAPEHLRHLIRLAGAMANYVLVGSIPIGYIFRVTNFGPYASPSDKGRVTFSNAPLIWGNTPKSFLDIQFSGTYEFEFDGTNWNCTMYNVVQETPAAQIVYAASVTLALMTSNDQLFTIGIPFQLGISNYRVIGSLVGLSGNWNNDNDVMCVVVNKLSMSFDLAVRRVSAGVIRLGYDFSIVR